MNASNNIKWCSPNKRCHDVFSFYWMWNKYTTVENVPNVCVQLNLSRRGKCKTNWFQFTDNDEKWWFMKRFVTLLAHLFWSNFYTITSDRVESSRIESGWIGFRLFLVTVHNWQIDVCRARRILCPIKFHANEEKCVLRDSFQSLFLPIVDAVNPIVWLFYQIWFEI